MKRSDPHSGTIPFYSEHSERVLSIRLLISVAVFTSLVTNLFAQSPPVTSVGPATFVNGSYSVPVTVTGFTNVGNISVKLRYDNDMLIYTGVLLNSGLQISSLYHTPVTDQSGVFRMSCTSATALLLNAPTSTMMLLTFRAKDGIEDEQVPLKWSTTQGDCDMTPPAPEAFTPEITPANQSTYFINGFINIPPVPAITGAHSACKGIPGNTYSTKPGMTDYSWSVSSGGIITGGGTSTDNSVTVTWQNKGIQSIELNYTGEGGRAETPSIFTVNVGETFIPSISGNNSSCTGNPGVVYTTEPGMTNYSWTVSSGGTITAGGTPADNSITVNWGIAGPQSVSVNYTDGTCTAESATVYPITVKNNVERPVFAKGSTSARCQRSELVTYTASANNCTGLVYSLDAVSLSGGNSIDPLTGTVSYVSGWNGNSVILASSEGCNGPLSATHTVVINAIPASPVSVSVSVSANPVCSGSPVIYTATPVNGGPAPSYQWKVNGVITGNNSPAFNYIPSNNDAVMCILTSDATCVLGNPASSGTIIMNVNQPPSQPGAFTVSAAAVCQGITNVLYTVPNDPAVTYNWSFSGTGATITGSTNSVSIGYSSSASSGNLSVTATNGCGTSTPGTLAITVNTQPAPAGIITGPASVNAGTAGVVYSVPAISGATGYLWTIPSGATIVDGNNTNRVTVDFSTAASAGVVSVRGINACGAGTLSPPLNFTPDARAITVTADLSQSKIYGNPDPVFTYTVSPALISGDSFTGSLSRAPGENAGTGYPITLGTLSAGAGYTITFVPADFVINKAQLQITADSKQKNYLEANPALTFSYTGFVNAETISVLDMLPFASTTALQNSDAGNYDIIVSGGFDNNYSYVYNKGILTIRKINQVINFAEIPSGLRVTQQHLLEINATSGLQVTLQSSDPGKVTISGTTLIVTGDGSSVIRATQAGNINWNPAPDVLKTIITLPTFDNINSLFTPNGDGMNDYWYLPDIEQYGFIQVHVYNRFGQEVYEASAYKNDWDGTFNDKPLPAASYYYIIKSSKMGTLKGVVNLVR